MDSVRTARRLGAERAMIIYRRSEEEMPARIEEVKHAKEEGVEFLTLHNPIEYIADEQGKVKQVVLQKMELPKFIVTVLRRAPIVDISKGCSVVYTAVYSGYTIPPFYDSMIMKVMTYANDRKSCPCREPAHSGRGMVISHLEK